MENEQDKQVKREPLTVGVLRQQCALKNTEAPVIIKIGDRYVTATKAWPDTALSPAGAGFYIEVENG